jgi:hypothetical protein
MLPGNPGDAWIVERPADDTAQGRSRMMGGEKRAEKRAARSAAKA